MDFRHIFSFLKFFLYFSNQKLGRTQGKKPKDLLYMIKLSRSVLFLEKKLVICWAFETIIQLLYLLKRLLKVQEKKHHKSIFLVERQN